ncbi:MAG TPA: CDP-diacylglycerol--serine O-phosphatidyltransferase [Bacteroidales bacterium]|nr:CDP-diacylglycerol--serine O-phosphatidyltransferase [Bacteroidales bacterium]
MNDQKIKIFSIPNFITLINLLCGCLSIVFAFNNLLIPAALLIFAAGIFDFLDGFAARLLKTYSDIGKQLDSLADVVSFGVAPSVIVFKLLEWTVLTKYNDVQLQNPLFTIALPGLAFILALFSALRLAKFNIDSRQSDSFIGVPTPAAAFLVASFPFIVRDYPNFQHIILNEYVLLIVVIVLSVLLISEIPLISLKFKNFNPVNNKSRYLLLTTSIVLLILFHISAFPIIFILYLIISVIDPLIQQKR